MGILVCIIIGALVLLSVNSNKNASEKEVVKEFVFLLIFFTVMVFIMWLLCIVLPSGMVDFFSDIFE
jgi:hypothetical protein